MCHVSRVTYHVSNVTCHIFFYKVVELVGGRSVINSAYTVKIQYLSYTHQQQRRRSRTQEVRCLSSDPTCQQPHGSSYQTKLSLQAVLGVPVDPVKRGGVRVDLNYQQVLLYSCPTCEY